ncbi:MAG: divalent-cation tolerance protein CutA [Candidatus Brocadiia bacterium]|jgi:periplasmic divalent cation tolerance protein|nr:divalent-cation tolerance protein CutA [Candidatus Brocadiia bacterium]
MTGEHVQVLTTTEAREEAESIARALTEQRLAACVQIVGPVTSTYRWKGKVETAEEWLCIIKSRKALYERIEQAIKAIHSYETPEIIALPIVAGSAAYLNWLDEELKEA